MQPDPKHPGVAQWHPGQCHCGRVRFEFYSSVDAAVECNCSYCVRKAALHHRVTADRFVLVQGADALTQYRFGSFTATHFFCANCGIHTHCRPRSAPDQINVNLHCAIEPTLRPAEVRQFDGRSWQEASPCNPSSAS